MSTSKQSLPRGVSTPFSLAYLTLLYKFYNDSYLRAFIVQIYFSIPLLTLKGLFPTAKDMEVPTPRAISERLVKIRTMAKANFTVSSGKNTSAPPTPRKKVKKEPVPKKAGGGIVKKKGIAKPKRAGKFERYVLKEEETKKPNHFSTNLH